MSEPRDNVLFLGGRALAEAGYNKTASGMARHYPAAAASVPQSAQFHPQDHRLAAHPHPLYHPPPGPLPYLYARDYALAAGTDRPDQFHANDRFARHDLSDALVQQQPGASPAPRRRPSLLPANPVSEFAYSPYMQSPYSTRYDSDRFSDYPLPGYDRNKSLAAAQLQQQQQQHQQAVVAATAASLQNRNVMTMASQMHLLGNSAGHRQQQVTSSSALPGARQPHQHIAHHAYDADIESVPKRPRLITEQKSALHQPLHIDIRDVHEIGKKPAYTPQVEAISPTLPNEDLRQDLSPFKSTKDDLVQNINRIDREISEAETQIAKLRKKQLELEAASKPSAAGSEVPEPTTESKQQSVAQLIYSDNRKKAHMTHSLLDRISGVPASSSNLTSLLPLYNQPSDIASYHINKEKFKDLKPKLMAMLRRQREHDRAREQFLTQTYDRLSVQWREKMDARDANPTRRGKDCRQRDFFEKQFPELRKQREDKERLSRAGQRIRSDADMDDIMEGLQEQEAEDKKMRSYAVVPPIQNDKKYVKPVFINRNNLVEDPMAEYKERRHVNVWTDSEKDLFREKFLLHPKNFGLISSYLEKKSVRDCVQYYYSSKKSENYKQLLRKHVKKRTRALVKQQQAAAAAAAATGKSSSLARQSASAPEADAAAASAQGTTVSAIPTVSALHEQRSLISSVADRRCILMGDLKSAAEKENEQSNADTRLCHECFICKSRVESLSKSRPITKANCHHYGITAETLTGEPRACLDCRFKYIRKQCPIPSCKTPERKVKRLKSLPQKWFDLSAEERRSVADKLSVPLDVKKGCIRCIMRIARTIGVSADRLITYNEIWNEEDISLLRKLLKEHGCNWNLISEALKGKSRKECKNFYYNNKCKYKLESDVRAESYDSDFWNDMTDDSEETSSADEGNGRSTSDTASAPSPSAPAEATGTSVSVSTTSSGKLQDLRGLSSSLVSLKSDNDSNATLSADEGHADADPLVARSSASESLTHFSSSSAGPYSRPPEGLIAQRQQRVPSFLINPNAPSTTNRSHAPAPKEEPTCVRDLIYQAIEMSLQGPGPGPSKTPDKVHAPSPQSHLVTAPAGYADHRSFADRKDEVRLSPNAAAQDARHAAQYSSPSSLSRPEGLMMSYSHQLTHLNAAQRQPPVLMENEVQDLSKKNTSFREPVRSQTPQSRKDRPLTPSTFPFQSMPPPAHSNADSAAAAGDGRRSVDFYAEQQGRSLKPAHAGPMPRTVIPRPPPRTPTSSGRPLVPPPPLISTSPSPKPKTDSRSPHPAGSITQGTPVAMTGGQGVLVPGPYGHPYDALMRSHAMAAKDVSGSIMLGTPVHQDVKRKGDMRVGPYEVPQQFYRRPSPNPPPHAGSPLPRSVLYPGHPDPYASLAKGDNRGSGKPDPHPSTNQLLIDFNTSKQMLARRGSSGEGKESPHTVRGRDSASPQIPNQSRMPANYAPHTGAPHLHGPTTVYTPSLADRSFFPVAASSPASQMRQNVIQTWTQKGTSVIQSTKSSSPRSEQRSDVPSPQSFVRKSFQPIQYPSNPSALENFQTLVNAAAAQQSLAVPVSENKMPDRRLPHGYIKNESDCRSPMSPKDQRQDSAADMRRPSSRPDWSDSEQHKQAASRRKAYMPGPDDGRKMAGSPFLPAHPAMYPLHGQPQMALFRDHFAKEHGMPAERRPGQPQLSKQQRAEMDQETSRIFSQCFQKDQPAAQPVPGPNARFTAANLIDAIITHQINQPVDGKSAADQSVISEHPKAEKLTEDILQANQRLMHPVSSHSRQFDSHMYPQPGSTLGDHISSIISRTFSDKPDVRVRAEERRPPEAAASSRQAEQSPGRSDRSTSWKLRRALQQERDDSSRPSSRSSSVSSQPLVLSANVEPISPPAAPGEEPESAPVSHCRPASHQSLDRTPPALEILEDMASNEPPADQ